MNWTFGDWPFACCRNYNYGAAGDYLGKDLLNNPDTVAQDDVTSWKTALWFWNVNNNCHTAITSGQRFGATIQAINGAVEYNGGNIDAVNDRISHYTNYCNQFSVDEAQSLGFGKRHFQILILRNAGGKMARGWNFEKMKLFDAKRNDQTVWQPFWINHQRLKLLQSSNI